VAGQPGAAAGRASAAAGAASTAAARPRSAAASRPGPELASPVAEPVEHGALAHPGGRRDLLHRDVLRAVAGQHVQLRRETDEDSIWYRQLPGTLTGDVVGTVEQAGPDTDPALAGTRVAVLLEDACADYVLADTGWLAPVPAGLDAAAACMLPLVGAVALGALRAGRLAPGDTVLITAAAGAIGHLAVQLARRQGAGQVIATASPAKLGFLKELGADVAIDYTQPGSCTRPPPRCR
jgi:NADPH:quinone reductase